MRKPLIAVWVGLVIRTKIEGCGPGAAPTNRPEEVKAKLVAAAGAVNVAPLPACST